jgi:hypothetical protein
VQAHCWAIGLPSEQDFFDEVPQAAPEAFGLSDCKGKEQDEQNEYCRRNGRNEPDEQDKSGHKQGDCYPRKNPTAPVWFHIVTSLGKLLFALKYFCGICSLIVCVEQKHQPNVIRPTFVTIPGASCIGYYNGSVFRDLNPTVGFTNSFNLVRGSADIAEDHVMAEVVRCPAEQYHRTRLNIFRRYGNLRSRCLLPKNAQGRERYQENACRFHLVRLIPNRS